MLLNMFQSVRVHLFVLSVLPRDALDFALDGEC